MQFIENETQEVVDSYNAAKAWRNTFAFTSVLFVLILIYQCGEVARIKKIAESKASMDAAAVENYKQLLINIK